MKLAPHLLSFFLLPAALLAQGSLTPPGAPAPTQKSLDQIEPRTPISSLPFAITSSGSYYLTGNLSVTSGNGITISADQVTLDLNGFAISSTANPAAGVGINIPNSRRNLTIRNGFITSPSTFAAGAFTSLGFVDGIRSTNASTANVRISDLSVHGIGGDAINFATTAIPTAVVERCTVSVCVGLGIVAGVVRDCSADTTGNTAINAELILNCYGETVNAGSAAAVGINAVSTAENCRGVSVSGFGVSATTAANCRGTSTSGSGIGCIVAVNCEGTSTSGSAGILAIGGTVSFSRGRRDGGNAITCTNAIGCTVTGSGIVSAANKSLGTP